MRTMIMSGIVAAFLVVLAIASGCEDSPVTAGKDDQMFVVALPPTVHVDPDDPTAPMESTIVATVVNATGTPKSGLLVFFSSSGGELASSTQPVETDSNGNAYDTLTMLPGGPGDVTVTATSTSLTETATVTNGACEANVPPTASFTVGDQTSNADGTKSVEVTSTSTDVAPTPPGAIKSYDWDCGNASPVGTTAIETCTYRPGTASTVYTIRLTVRDNGLGGSGPTYACQKSGTTTHTVTIAAAPVTPPTQ
jgi:hypothetical protein